MKLNEYQITAAETASYPQVSGVSYCIFGLTGEAGEIANKYKKVIRDDGGILSDEKRIAIADELGDVLWYVAMLADELGYNLEDVARMNVEKLQKRKDNGTIHGSGDNR